MLRREIKLWAGASAQAQNGVSSSLSRLPERERMVKSERKGVGKCPPSNEHPGKSASARHVLQPKVLLPFMPRYYFHTRIGDELIADPEGEELRNPDRAWEMARAMILELLRSEGADERLLNATVEVTDDDGEIVLEFPFAEALLDGGNASMTKH